MLIIIIVVAVVVVVVIHKKKSETHHDITSLCSLNNARETAMDESATSC